MASKKLTTEQSMKDFKQAYSAKAKLVKREKEDFLFALGKQWDDKDVETLEKAGVKAVTDNRIQPNIHLVTGLERQNRSDFKAFPEGEEDSLKAEIASALFKHAIKMSDFSYKSSDQFKDGITCGESHLELYLDNTDSLINGKPCFKKVDGNSIFPEPGCREYDFSDARYVYKIKPGLSEDDLIALFPDQQKKIERATSGKLELDGMDGEEAHLQKRTYGREGQANPEEPEGKTFDLIERYYKKNVETYFVGDVQTGEIKEAKDKEYAEEFKNAYLQKIQQEQEQHQMATAQFQQQAQTMAMQGVAVDPAMAPPPPPPADPERFRIIKRMVPEIWCFAHVPGMSEPLAHERAWFYPEWKAYPFIPFFARFSTAPLTGDDAHLLVQGLVHGVKNAQERHNKAATLMLRHLNTVANSGWIAEEDAWVDPKAVKQFGSTPGINLEYKKGMQKPDRITPVPLSQGHAQITAESAEDIKAEMGINSDLLAAQEGSAQSGRAIALRQKQGLLMIQEIFDNLSRSRTIAGKFLLSQLGKVFDTETAKKVLGQAFLTKNFPPLMLATGQVDPNTGMPAQQPMPDPKTGQPMQFDEEMAELAIGEVLAGNLGEYDVSVGEAVSSETIRMANAAELSELNTSMPGLIPPDIMIEESQLPQSTKTRILAAVKNAQMAAMAPPMGPPQAKPAAA